MSRSFLPVLWRLLSNVLLSSSFVALALNPQVALVLAVGSVSAGILSISLKGNDK